MKKSFPRFPQGFQQKKALILYGNAKFSTQKRSFPQPNLWKTPLRVYAEIVLKTGAFFV